MSVEYITRLEQGRDRHPSPPVLSALADALQLTPSERIHLHRLTKSADPGFSCMGDALTTTPWPTSRDSSSRTRAPALFTRTGTTWPTSGSRC
ncbi:helix-turn-helix domain-containing protein [Nocardia lijiangensis]|uniref:helix-turn-helix domain-containing protein n=1 Tax=Nocardia lijiangensis TaxID=299618 RepID=UPI0027D82F54|nr:helix-turn-helix transcriptional regulator [Nocardia lijiangensis]